MGAIIVSFLACTSLTTALKEVQFEQLVMPKVVLSEFGRPSGLKRVIPPECGVEHGQPQEDMLPLYSVVSTTKNGVLWRTSLVATQTQDGDIRFYVIGEVARQVDH